MPTSPEHGNGLLQFDMFVIGTGPAGQRAAVQAVKLGKRVSICERRDVVEGICINTGTIPSKTFREAVLYLTGFRQRGIYGSSFTVKEDIAMADLLFRCSYVVEREIVAALQDVGKKSDRFDWDRTEWTRRVKTRVALIGEDRGYCIGASGIEQALGRRSEWLYDLTWLDFADDGELVDLPLILESEWDRSGLQLDFNKLLVSRAEHRIMVWSEVSRTQFRDRVKELGVLASSCKLVRSGEQIGSSSCVFLGSDK